MAHDLIWRLGTEALRDGAHEARRVANGPDGPGLRGFSRHRAFRAKTGGGAWHAHRRDPHLAEDQCPLGTLQSPQMSQPKDTTGHGPPKAKPGSWAQQARDQMKRWLRGPGF